MCTAVTLTTKDHYFGRNLDLEYSYNETVTITPRNFPLNFRKLPPMPRHFAMIGMAYVAGGYPLYYDAVNEHGLAMAGLNFPKNAVYRPERAGTDNVTPFEFIPWVLGQCADIPSAKELISRINLLDEAFAPELPLSPLHWIIADKHEAIVVEAVADGIKVYSDPAGILTNNPPFDFMLHYLAGFRDLSPETSENRFSSAVELPAYCQGLAAMGLPGDYSSASRFVRAAFAKLNSVCGDSESESVSQFFHLLGSVEMPRGAVKLGEGIFDITVYSACCNQDKGIYYYTTYDNRHISAVDMHRENLEGDALVSYQLSVGDDIMYHN